MKRIVTRAALAALVVVAGVGRAAANEFGAGAPAFVAGNGENRSVSYAGGQLRGVPVEGRFAIVGSGENTSLRYLDPAPAQPRRYIAVIEGGGENQSVRHIPLPQG